MDWTALITLFAVQNLPALFGLLVGLALLLGWMALAPAPPAEAVEKRLGDYLDRGDIVDDAEMARPFAGRVILPIFRRVLRILGRLGPTRNMAATRRLLAQAGELDRFSALDFFGLRILLLAGLGVAAFLIFGPRVSLLDALRNALIAAGIGFMAPRLLLRSRARRRQHQISRALPDALDMLTISVQAGMAFESALLRIGDKWKSPLTQEFRRAVAEIRVGTSHDEALRRMAERSGVPDLNTFVAVLVQSAQLGVSIADVLHSQAAQMRIKRRQRAEELARQAGVKMVLPLVAFVFPALLVVILGPAIPILLGFFASMAGQR